MATKLADITLTKQSGTVLTLGTEGKYVPYDAQFDLSVRSATSSSGSALADVNKATSSETGNINASLGEKSTTEPSSGYYIKLVASGSGNSAITTSGWIETGSLDTASATSVRYFPITEATVTQNIPTVNVSTGLVTATVSTTAGYTPGGVSVSSNALQLTTQGATTYPTSSSSQVITAGVYLTGDQTILPVSTAGIIAGNIRNGAIVTVGDSDNSSRIANVTGTFTNSSTVSAGQIAATSSDIRSGYSAWVDGLEVQGVLAGGDYNVAVTDASVSLAPTYTSATSGTITDVTTVVKPTGTDGTDYWTITPSGSKTIGNARAKATATITTAGYIEAGSKTTPSYTDIPVTIEENQGIPTYIPKASISGTLSNATATTVVEPGNVSVVKQTITSGATDAASGDATTTAPSTGVYVAVKATAAANDVGSSSSISGSGNVSISSAGYAPAGLTGNVTVSGIATATTSLKESLTTYVPITTANPSLNGGILSGDSTAVGTNVTLSSIDNGIKIQTAYTASSTNIYYDGAVNGWVSKIDGDIALTGRTSASTNGTAYYVTSVTVPINSSFAVSTAADTELDASSALLVANNAYRKVNLTNSENGSVSISDAGSTAWTASSSTEGNLSVAAYNGSMLESSIPIVTNGEWVNVNVISTGVYYGRVAVTAGTITNNTSGGESSGTINFGNQIKIGRGYYNADVYYTAQEPTGNIQLIQPTTTDVSAYATATVRSVVADISGGALSGTATASGVGCTFGVSDTSGVTITTACVAARAKVTCSATLSGWASDTIQELDADVGIMTPTTYYLDGVTLTAPMSGTRSFYITVPNGPTTATFVFNVNSSGNVTITEQ